MICDCLEACLRGCPEVCVQCQFVTAPRTGWSRALHWQTGCAAAARVARRMAVHELVYSAGSVGVLRVDMQGVQALQQNDAVDAVYVHLRPASMDDWAKAQSHRQTSAFTRFSLATYRG